MKKVTGKAKFKKSSTYVYAKSENVFDIVGIYIEYKNGRGMGVFADGEREYKINLVGTEFEEKYGKQTVIACRELEIIELNQVTEFPLNSEESLRLLDFVSKNSLKIHTKEKMLEAFLESEKRKSELPFIDLSTIYEDETN